MEKYEPVEGNSTHSPFSEKIDHELEEPEEDESSVPTALIPGRYSFIDALGIVCGIIIGSGIFSSPGVALERAGSPGLTLIAWSFAGMLVICTASCYMELAGLMPNAGGDFEYLKRAFGDRAGFSFAWFNFWISKTGSQAIIVTIFGRYFDVLIGGSSLDGMYDGSEGESATSKVASVTILVAITTLNCLSVKESTVLQNILTMSKLSLVLTLFLAAIVFSLNPATQQETAENLHDNLSVESSFRGSKGLFGFCTALVACLWSFDGWADLNFMLEELKNPQRLPKITSLAVCAVTVAYILCNIAYLMLLSRQDMTASTAIGIDYGTAMSNGNKTAFWPVFIAAGVMLSTLGSAHGSIMTGGRAFYAVARGGKAPRFLALLNRIGSPYGALLAQGTWALVLLLLPGSNFSTLLDYFGPASWFFYAMGATSVLVLRHKEPHVHRPFSVPFYPVPPIITICVALGIISSSFATPPNNLYVGLAFGFIAISIPFHIFWFERDTVWHRLAERAWRAVQSDQQR